MAVGHAVCRSLAPGSFHYWRDAFRTMHRLVALYCQWAVGRAAEPGTEATRDAMKETQLMRRLRSWRVVEETGRTS